MTVRFNNSRAKLGGVNKTYAPYNPDNLVLVYDTTKEPDNLQVSVPLNGTVNCTIYWGDGTSDKYTTSGFKTHTYSKHGVYTVQISGTMTSLNYGAGATNNNRAKLRRCLSFGSVGLTSLYRGLRDCQNLIQCPTTLPDGVTSLQECFLGCVSFNDSRISAWNTAAVTTMNSMFSGCTSFNADLGAWNTAAVASMANMFFGCTSFNADLSAWNTALVANMGSMFLGCTSFNADLSAWNTAAVTNMSFMFYNCTSFNADLSAWNTAAVTNMFQMFVNCTSFNADLSAWNTALVANMGSMFYGCTSFNADLSAWNTASVTSMRRLFAFCTFFNSDLSAWNTASVTDMFQMFYTCRYFNSNVSAWNTSAVVHMGAMFFMCESFSSDLGNWDLSALNSADRLNNFLFVGGRLTTADYDATLIGWEANKELYRNDLQPHFGASKYTAGGAAEAARTSLISYGWTITDGGAAA